MFSRPFAGLHFYLPPGGAHKENQRLLELTKPQGGQVYIDDNLANLPHQDQIIILVDIPSGYEYPYKHPIAHDQRKTLPVDLASLDSLVLHYATHPADISSQKVVLLRKGWVERVLKDGAVEGYIGGDWGKYRIIEWAKIQCYVKQSCYRALLGFCPPSNNYLSATIIIFPSPVPSNEEEIRVYRSVSRRHIIVHARWVQDSFTAGHMVSVSKYPVTPPPAERGTATSSAQNNAHSSSRDVATIISAQPSTEIGNQEEADIERESATAQKRPNDWLYLDDGVAGRACRKQLRRYTGTTSSSIVPGRRRVPGVLEQSGLTRVEGNITYPDAGSYKIVPHFSAPRPDTCEYRYVSQAHTTWNIDKPIEADRERYESLLGTFADYALSRIPRERFIKNLPQADERPTYTTLFWRYRNLYEAIYPNIIRSGETLTGAELDREWRLDTLIKVANESWNSEKESWTAFLQRLPLINKEPETKSWPQFWQDEKKILLIRCDKLRAYMDSKGFSKPRRMCNKKNTAPEHDETDSGTATSAQGSVGSRS